MQPWSAFPLQLKSADEIEFWMRPDKDGWLQSQGEVLKTWRRRWFVLKEGYIFRFLNNDIDSDSKPRGIVDLSKITDVSGIKGGIANNKHIVKLGTEKSFIQYMCDRCEEGGLCWDASFGGCCAISR